MLTPSAIKPLDVVLLYLFCYVIVINKVIIPLFMFDFVLLSPNIVADLPDMVQDFQVRAQDPKSVWLEWNLPRKPGVSRYKVL